MSARLWYLRWGLAWRAVLGACGAAAVTAGLMARWPDDAFLLAPALLACCAAAAAFVYDEETRWIPEDERAYDIHISINPRGGTTDTRARLIVSGGGWKTPPPDQ